MKHEQVNHLKNQVLNLLNEQEIISFENKFLMKIFSNNKIITIYPGQEECDLEYKIIDADSDSFANLAGILEKGQELKIKKIKSIFDNFAAYHDLSANRAKNLWEKIKLELELIILNKNIKDTNKNNKIKM